MGFEKKDARLSEFISKDIYNEQIGHYFNIIYFLF